MLPEGGTWHPCCSDKHQQRSEGAYVRRGRRSTLAEPGMSSAPVRYSVTLATSASVMLPIFLATPISRMVSIIMPLLLRVSGPLLFPVSSDGTDASRTYLISLQP